MSLREQLQEGFLYDRWANDKWLEVVTKLENGEPDVEIMGHILFAQRIWLERVLSEDDVPASTGDMAADLEAIHLAWFECLAICDPGAFVSYTNLKGESHFSTVEQIARHVVNHGTYHRGQLRGLMAAQGSEEFEETDLIRFYRELA